MLLEEEFPDNLAILISYLYLVTDYYTCADRHNALSDWHTEPSKGKEN